MKLRKVLVLSKKNLIGSEVSVFTLDNIELARKTLQKQTSFLAQTFIGSIPHLLQNESQIRFYVSGDQFDGYSCI